jgi:DNA-binding beta-propeller fold protein YncE
VRGAGFGFTDRGLHELKGVEGEWRLFEITSVDGTPRSAGPGEEDSRALRDAIEPPPLRKRRRVRLAAAAAGLAVVIALVAVALTSMGDSTAPTAPPLRIAGNAAAKIDPDTGKLTSVVTLPAIPIAIASGEGSIWVAEQGGVVSKIDPRTGHVQNIPVGQGLVGIAVSPRIVWALSRGGEVTPIDARTGVTGAPIEIPVGMTRIAFGEGGVWVIGRFSVHDCGEGACGMTFRIDPVTREVAGHAYYLVVSNDIAVGEGAVWLDLGKIAPTPTRVAPFFGAYPPCSPTQGSCLVSHSTLKYEQLILFDGFGPMTVGANSVWTATSGMLYRVDPATSELTAQITMHRDPTGLPPTGVAVSGSRVWAAFGDGTITEVDAGTNKVLANYRIAAALKGITVDPDGALWFGANRAVSGR